MNEFDTVKTKGIKLNWWQILVIVVASVSILSMLIAPTYDFVTGRREVRYHNTEFASMELASYDFWARHNDYLWHFKDVDTAMEEIFSDRTYSQQIKEITRFESDENHLVFFSDYIAGPFFRPMTCIIRMFSLNENETGGVILAHLWHQEIEAISGEPRRKLFDEDRVARDIVLAYIHRDITAVANGDVPIYYGVGLGNAPAHLSILGYEPDDIIAFEYRDKDYYFWYYLSAPQFGEVLSDNIDISTSFMLAEVIELFDIQIIR